MSFWHIIAAERAALAADLADLSDEQWATPSLCADWSVRDVVAHMTAAASKSAPAFLVGFARARLRMERMCARGVQNYLGSDPRNTLALFRAIQHARGGPPGPTAIMVGETLVHAEDIRRPLGIHHDYPLAELAQAMNFYVSTNLTLHARDRIEGLHLVATDFDFEHGTGERVEGPLMSLVLATTGRGVGCDDLSGPGVPVLRGRCP